MANPQLNEQLLANLSPQEREVALKMLKEISAGKSDTFEQLKYADYEEIPVDVETFLYDKRYLGNGLIDPDGRFTVFPYWVDTLKKIFPNNLDTKYNTLVLTGSIGIGKSFCSVLCMLYLLHRMLCLKDPYTHYGLQPIDKITFSLINVTIDAAKGVAWDKLQQLVQSSPWFMEHGEVKGRSEIVWSPNKRIELVVGSNNNAVIGRAVFCLDGNTVIKTTESDRKLIDLVNKPVNVISTDIYGNYRVSKLCTIKPTIITNEEYNVELEDNTIIRCTGNHRLLTNDCTYKEVQYMEAGDKLYPNINIKNITKYNLDSLKQFYDVIEANPYHNFLIKTNSGYVISHNCNFTDEVNFSAMTTDVEKIKRKQRLLISQVDARMQSRFMKGTKLPTLQMIASSKSSDQSFLDSYIDTKKKNNSKTTLIIDEPQWVIRNDKDSPRKFWVAVGNKFLASEVLPIDAPENVVDNYRAKGYQMLAVPEGYYEAFVDNVELALTDIAGISSTSALKFISGVRLNEIKTNSYQNPFTKDIIEVGTNDNIQYSQYFDVKKVPQNCKGKPLYIHLDMSKSGDKTGIAGTWIMSKSAGSDTSAKYRVAFSVSVKAPKGYEISFEKARIFINWLRSQGFNIKEVTMDTYQSAQIKQQLSADGFKTNILSVDRLDNVPDSKQKICLPYVFFKSAIYEKKLELYEKCDLLTDEIVGLEKEPDGHVNHPEGGTQGSKDQADAVCGSLYNASQSIGEFVFNYGETLDDLVKVSTSDNETEVKKQINIEFEQALQEMFTPDSIKKQRQQSSDNSFLDFGNGPSTPLVGPITTNDGILIW